MGPASAAAKEGALVEETGGEHEDAGMAAVVGQQSSNMGGGGLLECFVVGEKPLKNRITQSILPCHITKNGHLWTHLCIGKST